MQRADDLPNASHLFHEYDVVPYPRTGPIEGFFTRNSDRFHLVRRENLLSDGADLFGLPRLLRTSSFYFVISANEIAGYVHYSDLNKSIAKIPFFARFQAIERDFWDRICHRISESDIRILFPNEAEKFIKRKSEIQAGNVGIGWTGIFSLPYILKLARFYGQNHLTDDEIQLLKDTRNRVAHSDQNLIDDSKDVCSLADTCELLDSLCLTEG